MDWELGEGDVGWIMGGDLDQFVYMLTLGI